MLFNKFSFLGKLISKANHSISSNPAYAPNSNTGEGEVERFYEDLQDLLELTPEKDVLYFIGNWGAKVGTQKNPLSNRQIWPWSTE